MMLKSEDGWLGTFTRQEADGAMVNGTRVYKFQSEPGDGHPTGSMGTVLGSLHHPDLGYMYFVEWDESPRVAIGVVERKIKKIEGN